MNIRELRQLIHDLPDDMNLEAAIDGTVWELDHVQVVKEWDTIYFGVNQEDLTESFMAWNSEQEESEDTGDWDPEDEPGAGDDDEWPEDREAFQASLAKTEDVDNILAWANADTCAGQSCAVPPKPTKPMDDMTEMM